jgi:hypothetical protein
MVLHEEGKARIGAGPDRLPSRRQTRPCALNNTSGRKTAQPWPQIKFKRVPHVI